METGAKIAFVENGVTKVRNFQHLVIMDSKGRVRRVMRADGIYLLATGMKERSLTHILPEESNWPVWGVDWYRPAFWFLLGLWAARVLSALMMLRYP